MKFPQRIFRIIRITCGLIASEAVGAQPQIVFDITPESGIPLEAKVQGQATEALAKGPENHGSLPKMLGDGVLSVRVRYFSNKVWKTEKEVNDYLLGLMADDTTGSYETQGWSEEVREPEVECIIFFADRKTGRLLLWKNNGCFRDGTGKWWFISLFNWYHQKHPNGDRRQNPISKPPDR